jgi:hypothetical protein
MKPFQWYLIGLLTLPAALIATALISVMAYAVYDFFIKNQHVECLVCAGRREFRTSFGWRTHCLLSKEHRTKYPAWRERYHRSLVWAKDDDFEKHQKGWEL